MERAVLCGGVLSCCDGVVVGLALNGDAVKGIRCSRAGHVKRKGHHVDVSNISLLPERSL